MYAGRTRPSLRNVFLHTAGGSEGDVGSRIGRPTNEDAAVRVAAEPGAPMALLGELEY